MYQHHQLYTSCMCQLINYLSQPCTQHVPQPKALINFIIQIRSTHQDQSPRQLSTICTISPRCASTKHITTTHNHHQDQYVLLIIYQDKYATSSINHVSTILLTSTSHNAPRDMRINKTKCTDNILQ
jgi:hypothetical protein